MQNVFIIVSNEQISWVIEHLLNVNKKLQDGTFKESTISTIFRGKIFVFNFNNYGIIVVGLQYATYYS